nr:PD40 domain-containing protein [Chloroflexia bacterium]
MWVRGRLVAILAMLLLTGGGAFPAVAREAPVVRAAARQGVAWDIAAYRALAIDGQAWAISPDGWWLAGLGTEPGEEQSLCVWAVATGESRCDPQLLLIDPTSIVWAPDSAAVAYAAGLSYPTEPNQEIRVFEVAAGTTTFLTGFSRDVTRTPGTAPEMVADGSPAWSPDSRELAFTRSGYSLGQTILMRVARAGGEPREIARLGPPEPHIVAGPMHWLADDSLLFAIDRFDGPDEQNGLWRIGVDGDNPSQVLAGDWGDALPLPRIANVSADGRWASVYSDPRVPPYPWIHGKRIPTRCSTSIAALTPVVDRTGEGGYVAAPPRFSPDGATAIFGIAPQASRGAALQSVAPVVMD